MSRKKIEIPIGKKVKGYGILNEFGEFDFIPEQTGSRPNGMKIVKSTDGFTIYECKETIRIVSHVKKNSEKLAFMSDFCKQVNELLRFFRDYDL